MTVTRFKDHILGPDTHTNRPAASGVPEAAIYECTTHSKFYKNVAGTWVSYGVLIPPGGSTSDVLAKASGTDGDVGWAAPSAGYTDEQARDAIGAALVAGTGMTITVDDAGNTITLASSGGGGGGLSQSYLGYNTIGASTVAPAIGNVYLKKITLAADGLLPSVEAYIANTADSVGSIAAAVNADSAGSPGSLLGYSMQPTTSFIPRPASGSNGPGRWFAVPLGIWLPAGDYWIAIMGIAGAITLAYDTGGSDRTYSTGGNAWFSDGGRYAISTTSNKYSIRASHLH